MKCTFKAGKKSAVALRFRKNLLANIGKTWSDGFDCCWRTHTQAGHEGNADWAVTPNVGIAEDFAKGCSPSYHADEIMTPTVERREPAFCSRSRQHELGQFLTPNSVADFMASLFESRWLIY